MRERAREREESEWKRGARRGGGGDGERTAWRGECGGR